MKYLLNMENIKITSDSVQEQPEKVTIDLSKNEAFEKLDTRKKRVVQALIINETLPKPKSKGQILREAGYSAKTATAPALVLRRPEIQAALKPVTSQLKDIRQYALNALAEKELTKVPYRDLVDSVDKITKNIQLLSGEDTDRNNVVISWKGVFQPIQNGDQYTLRGEEVGRTPAFIEGQMESLCAPQESRENGSND